MRKNTSGKILSHQQDINVWNMTTQTQSHTFSCTEIHSPPQFPSTASSRWC